MTDSPQAAINLGDVAGLEPLYATGLERGSSTGIASLDEHFSFAKGQVTVVTGWPNCGKSEFVDQLAINLVRSGDWSVAYYSPENFPIELHAAKLLEKWVGKPFAVGPSQRMSMDEVKAARQALRHFISFVGAPYDRQLGIGEILDGALYARDSKMLPRNFLLVIDPWNEIAMPDDANETKWIGDALSGIRRWARTTETHVAIIAHPAKQRRDQDGKLPVPRPDMISGSQHWWNKSDNAITVWRDYGDDTSAVEIHVQKVRFKNIGRLGVVPLEYSRVTGRYREPSRGAVYSGVNE